jgi:hypothetical protein
VSTALIVILVIAAIVLLAIVFIGGRRVRERRFEQRRGRLVIIARPRNRVPSSRNASASPPTRREQRAREVLDEAEQRRERAEHERGAATEHAERAREIDPDRDG